MLFKKKLSIVLFVIFCNICQVWGKVYSLDHDYGGGQSVSNCSLNCSHHTSNRVDRSRTYKRTWSSYFTNDRVISKPITQNVHDNDSSKHNPREYNLHDYKPVAYEKRAPVVNKLDDSITSYITGRGSIGSTIAENGNSYLNYQHTQHPIVIPTTLEENEHHSKPLSNNFESLNLNIPLFGTFNTLRVHCQQHLHSELNERGEIVDSVKEICNPLKPVTTTSAITTSTATTTTAKSIEAPSSLATKPYAVKEKRYERLLTFTPRGINCRKVMNSDFNERGEIVDTVIEVCDPPTTTTTTTRRPTLETTTKRTTTTPKPLVKVCRPVMNSYLNDAGEIIDSVTEVCTMVPQK